MINYKHECSLSWNTEKTGNQVQSYLARCCTNSFSCCAFFNSCCKTCPWRWTKIIRGFDSFRWISYHESWRIQRIHEPGAKPRTKPSRSFGTRRSNSQYKTTNKYLKTLLTSGNILQHHKEGNYLNLVCWLTAKVSTQRTETCPQALTQVSITTSAISRRSHIQISTWKN